MKDLPEPTTHGALAADEKAIFAIGSNDGQKVDAIIPLAPLTVEGVDAIINALLQIKQTLAQPTSSATMH